jgi:hypothetical protein
MPTVGGFHGKFWLARSGGGGEPAGGYQTGSYASWQNTTHRAVSLSMAIWWPPLDVLRPWMQRLRWLWAVIRRLAVMRLTAEQLAVLEHAVALMQSPEWADAQQAVQACATTPKFHQVTQWVEYGRAIKADGGQAQNVYRHVKVVQALKAAHPGLSNPEAHLLAELAYHGFARIDRRQVQIVKHKKRIIAHAAQHVQHERLITR